MRKIWGGVIMRATLIVITIILQVVFWFGLIYILGDYSEWLFVILIALNLFSIAYVIVQDTYPENKIPWIILMSTMPLVGGLIYFVFSGHRISKRRQALYEQISNNLKLALLSAKDNHQTLLKDDIQALRQSTYISNTADAPAQTNTQVTYFKLGEEKLEALLNELKKAKKFIFLEYFIIEEGKMWSQVEEVLVQKASEGVDIRIMYDDMGCWLTLPQDFAKRLSSYENIDCRVFNRFTHLFNANFNNRDHRKICVIDGNTGFTGGINIADEYINHKIKHGHWKDTAIMLKGDAVYNLTVMFLSMWETMTEQIENYADYAPTKTYEADGVIQPFSDTPLDEHAVGETVYMGMLNRARDYVYITTPYLIISREMRVALMSAAKSGVDVRIILPGIGDKQFVHFLSRSYYEELLKAGVKIYEYTPGFIHSKMFISDDDISVVGTINLDYRSLSLHYECAVWMYKASVIQEIKEDFLETQEKCREITLDNFEHKGKFGILKFTFLGILRTFSPLM